MSAAGSSRRHTAAERKKISRSMRAYHARIKKALRTQDQLDRTGNAVSLWLGHTTVTTTATYLNATTHMLHELNERVPLALVKGQEIAAYALS
jgi:hypothetical protein